MGKPSLLQVKVYCMALKVAFILKFEHETPFWKCLSKKVTLEGCEVWRLGSWGWETYPPSPSVRRLPSCPELTGTGLVCRPGQRRALNCGETGWTRCGTRRCQHHSCLEKVLIQWTWVRLLRKSSSDRPASQTMECVLNVTTRWYL